MTYEEKVKKALSLAENLDQVSYIEDKIKVSDKINRRTKEGREFTLTLLNLVHIKAQSLIDAGEQPF